MPDDYLKLLEYLDEKDLEAEEEFAAEELNPEEELKKLLTELQSEACKELFLRLERWGVDVTNTQIAQSIDAKHPNILYFWITVSTGSGGLRSIRVGLPKSQLLERRHDIFNRVVLLASRELFQKDFQHFQEKKNWDYLYRDPKIPRKP